jgi:hypothetical protein
MDKMTRYLNGLKAQGQEDLEAAQKAMQNRW